MSRITLPTHTYPSLLTNFRTGLLIHTYFSLCIYGTTPWLLTYMPANLRHRATATREQCIWLHRQSSCNSFLPRSRLGRRMYGHRPTSIRLHTHNSLPVLFYQTARWQYVATLPTYTYISLIPTKYSYKLIISHLLLTMLIRDYALAPYRHTSYLTSSHCTCNSPTLKATCSCPAYFTHCLIPWLSSLPNLIPLPITSYGPIITYPSSRRHPYNEFQHGRPFPTWPTTSHHAKPSILFPSRLSTNFHPSFFTINPSTSIPIYTTQNLHPLDLNIDGPRPLEKTYNCFNPGVRLPFLGIYAGWWDIRALILLI